VIVLPDLETDVAAAEEASLDVEVIVFDATRGGVLRGALVVNPCLVGNVRIEYQESLRCRECHRTASCWTGSNANGTRPRSDLSWRRCTGYGLGGTKVGHQ